MFLLKAVAFGLAFGMGSAAWRHAPPMPDRAAQTLGFMIVLAAFLAYKAGVDRGRRQEAPTVNVQAHGGDAEASAQAGATASLTVNVGHMPWLSDTPLWDEASLASLRCDGGGDLLEVDAWSPEAEQARQLGPGGGVPPSPAPAQEPPRPIVIPFPVRARGVGDV